MTNNASAPKSYTDLRVWDESIMLVTAVYKVAKTLPSTERFGLVTQLQRAAVSVPANIAEGMAAQLVVSISIT